eukprot:GFUD01035699.1.p1 GENE.GFUD01035699.1~~GFUD01035699.1.p1  ORF type:complete len:463 (+),score=142.43 GFUD01035699.1:137-1525(+)
MGSGADSPKSDLEERMDLLGGEGSVGEDDKPGGHVDGGWGWLVVAASFGVICVLDGIGYSFGVFLEPLIADLGVGRGALSMAGSLQSGVYSLSGPVVAMVVSRWGERKACMVGSVLSAVGVLGASYAVGIKTLILGYSVVTGLGFGLMYLPSIVIVSQHFTTRRALATGIVLCAAGAGTFLFAPLTEQLVEQMGWRGAMRVLAVACLGCVVCGSAMVPGGAVTEGVDGDTEFEGRTDCTRKVERKFLARIIGSELSSSPALPVLSLLMMGDCMSALSLYIPYTHLPPAATAVGISPANAAFLISTLGVTNTLGRLVSGWLTDKPCINPMILITVSLTAAVPTLYLFSVISSYWMFLTLSCMFGFLTGMWVSAIPSALVNLIGVPLLAPAFGLLTAFRGVMILSGPPLAGMVVDVVGVKGVAMVVSGVAMSVACVFFILSVLVDRRKERRGEYEDRRGEYEAL